MVLVGRATECSRIDSLLDQTEAGRATSLLIEGEGGIGKTALLDYARSRATARGMSVLSCRGVEAESDLPFSALLELLLPLLDTIELPSEQKSVLLGALALGPPIPADRFAVSVAALSLVAAASEAVPLLMLVDDAHWVDAASLEVVLFVRRRLHDDHTCLLLATRIELPATIERSGLDRLRLSGLDVEASRTLLRDSASPLTGRIADPLFAATAGNPLALLEVARSPLRDQIVTDVEFGLPIRSGPVIERMFSTILDSLSTEQRTALLVVAASIGNAAEPILSALNELSLDGAEVDGLESEALVTISDGRIDVRHPLLRSAAYHRASPAARRAVHRALAAGEARERRAWHLAQAAVSPDEALAAQLDDVAESAWQRTGYVAAAAAYERAAQLTTPGSRRCIERRIASARCFEAGGAFDRAIALLERAAADATDDPHLLAEIAQARARCEIRQGKFTDAADLLLAAARTIEDSDRERTSLLLGEATLALIPSERGREALETAERAVALARRGGEAHNAANLWLDTVKLLRGENGALEGLRLAEWAETVVFDAQVSELISHASHQLFWLEHFERARRLIDRTIEAARAATALGALPHLLAAKAQLEFRTGNWSLALAVASEAVTLGMDIGAPNPFTLAYLAWVEAGLGHEETCRAHAATAIDIAAPLHLLAALDYSFAALGLLELGLGDPDAAIERLTPVAELEELYGLRDPWVSPWRPDLIEAYIRAGKLDAAEEALARFESEARRAARSCPLAAAHRCRGMLAKRNFAADFEEAIRLHRQTPTPFELARTELAYGERLRRARRRVDARTHLRTAARIFDELAAAGWAVRARQELRASGESARRGYEADAELTPQELQVASIVAAGMSNKDVAKRLFISPRTVEAHLGHIYRKLGITSRDQLAMAVASRTRPADLPRTPTTSLRSSRPPRRRRRRAADRAGTRCTSPRARAP